MQQIVSIAVADPVSRMDCLMVSGALQKYLLRVHQAIPFGLHLNMGSGADFLTSAAARSLDRLPSSTAPVQPTFRGAQTVTCWLPCHRR